VALAGKKIFHRKGRQGRRDLLLVRLGLRKAISEVCVRIAGYTFLSNAVSAQTLHQG